MSVSAENWNGPQKPGEKMVIKEACLWNCTWIVIIILNKNRKLFYAIPRGIFD